MSAQTIMARLEEFKNRYLDKDGHHLLIGGLDSYLTPDKYSALAEKYHFVKYKSFHI